jgi:hypothetical protein
MTELQKAVELSLNSTGQTQRSAARRVQLLCTQELAKVRRKLGPPQIITCVWVDSNGYEWARVAFPHALFSRIKSAAAKLGITLEQFFDDAIRSYADSLKAKGGRK